MSSTQTISVLVVSDHPLFRDALVSVIASDPRFEPSSASSSDASAGADLIVIDFDLESGDPMSVFGRLAGAPCGSLVLLSSSNQHRAFHLIEAGARGVMQKSCSGEEILDAVHRLANGEAVIAKTFQRTISEAIRRRPAANGTLSGREVEILRLSAEGLSAIAIGQRLNLAESTIKSQLSRIYDKFDVTDRAAAVAVAFRRSLIS